MENIPKSLDLMELDDEIFNTGAERIKEALDSLQIPMHNCFLAATHTN